MELASSLTPEEVKKSLKEVIKKTRKNLPAPKYICNPSSKQIQQKVSVWTTDDPLLSQLRSLIQSHGHIAELDRDSKALLNSPSDQCASPCLERRKQLRETIKKTKYDWLHQTERLSFWSHIVFGVNRIMKFLENCSANTGVSEDGAGGKEKSILPDRHPLVCVLIDAGWLGSPLGHHIANLCASKHIRLVSVRPMGCLATCCTSTLYTLKKLIAVGVCTSDGAHADLLQWTKNMQSQLPVLNLTAGKVVDAGDELTQTTTGTKRTAAETSLQSMTESIKQVTVYENGEPWENYTIDPKKLYVSEAQSFPDEICLTLPQLWPYLENCSNLHRTTGDALLWDGSRDFPHPTPGVTYEPTVLRSVTPQTEEQRREKRKARKRVKHSKISKNATATPDCSIPT